MQLFETDTVKVVLSAINNLKFSNPENIEDISKSDIPKIKMIFKKKIGIIIEADISNPKNRNYFVEFENDESLRFWFAESEIYLI